MSQHAVLFAEYLIVWWIIQRSGHISGKSKQRWNHNKTFRISSLRRANRGTNFGSRCALESAGARVGIFSICERLIWKRFQ